VLPFPEVDRTLSPSGPPRKSLSAAWQVPTRWSVTLSARRLP